MHAGVHVARARGPLSWTRLIGVLLPALESRLRGWRCWAERSAPWRSSISWRVQAASACRRTPRRPPSTAWTCREPPSSWATESRSRWPSVSPAPPAEAQTLRLVPDVCCLCPLRSGGGSAHPPSRDAEQQHLAGRGRGRPHPAGALHPRHPLLEALRLREAGVSAGRHQRHPAEAEGQPACTWPRRRAGPADARARVSLSCRLPA